jgi:hypothetical protein
MTLFRFEFNVEIWIEFDCVVLGQMKLFFFQTVMFMMDFDGEISLDLVQEFS